MGSGAWNKVAKKETRTSGYLNTKSFSDSLEKYRRVGRTLG